MAIIEGQARRIVGGVDTHKIFTSQQSSMSRIAFSERVVRHDPTRLSPDAGLDAILRRVAPHQNQSTGSYGAGLLRFMQQAKVPVLEVTTPDKQVDVGAARTTISTPRMPLTPPFHTIA